MKRLLVGALRYVRVTTPRHAAPRGLKGPKAQGIRYERALGQHLGLSARHGLWWEYEDAAGRGYCQTDFVFREGSEVFVLEQKYTWTEAAQEELDGLYLPVVRRALSLPTYGIVVCKVLTTECRGLRVVEGLDEAKRVARGGSVVWHWIPLEPRSRRPAPGRHTPLDLKSLGL